MGVSEPVLEGTFIKGLKPDLHSAVRVLQPGGLTHAIKLSISIDENRLFGSSLQGGDSYRPTGSTTNFANRNIGSCLTRTFLSTPTTDRKGGTCKSKALQVLWVEPDESGEDECLEYESLHEHLDSVEVSLNSASGLTSPHTMKICGIIGGLDVVVLIDNGATHNFVSWELVDKIGLVLLGSNLVGVKMGNGIIERSQGICKGVHISLPDIQVVDDFLPLELGGTDVILGMKWLETLGEMTVNWKELTMEFYEGDRRVFLKGDPSLCRTLVSLKSIIRSLQHVKNGYFVELKQMEEENLTMQYPMDVIQSLLADFDDIFHMPNGLPPERHHEHSIVLIQDIEPISVCPYRYPYAQKSEIEKLVKEMLQADKFPIPVIDELLEELHGATMFSKLDLKSGYHQIRMKKDDVPKTAFRTHEGHYEFLVMPFGLTNASATFQSLMNKIFRPYLRKFVLVFFDDILVYSKTLEEHKKHLIIIFSCLREHQLYANKKKCAFAQQRIKYLGHVVSNDGVSADPSKISAMLEWPLPKNLKKLRGFLGLTGYYRKFVAGYGKIALALTDKLKKDNFSWDEDVTSAFQALKLAMATEEHQKWLTKLLGYDFDIQYKPGIENKAADALSRREDTVEHCFVMSVSRFVNWEEMGDDLLKDSELNSIKEVIVSGKSNAGEYTILDNRLFYKNRLVLPRTSGWIPRLFNEFHSGVISGHAGALKTYKRMAAELYWIGMKKDVIKFVSECEQFRPVTTVASESAFSAGGRVIDPHRASLGTDTVEMLICGADWYRHYYGLHKKNNKESDVLIIQLP
uniref:uncharacterized protein LOC122587997 n=1 Tax=Erigeron canadensis TaxID=72917 RepID=UPI001CB942D7|nr:uncharacterized protein LOC122587997 [Erigeron canadensis]